MTKIDVTSYKTSPGVIHCAPAAIIATTFNAIGRVILMDRLHSDFVVSFDFCPGAI